MKISSITEAIQSLYTIREKRDAEGGRDDRQAKQDSEQNPEDADSSGKKSEFQATVEKIGTAVQEFQAEPQAQANGLQAMVAGNGPGLRVILKDGTGAIVRQFTGEEFLRLREAASRDGSSKRGKILDQKL